MVQRNITSLAIIVCTSTAFVVAARAATAVATRAHRAQLTHCRANQAKAEWSNADRETLSVGHMTRRGLGSESTAAGRGPPSLDPGAYGSSRTTTDGHQIWWARGQPSLPLVAPFASAVTPLGQSSTVGRVHLLPRSGRLGTKSGGIGAPCCC